MKYYVSNALAILIAGVTACSPRLAAPAYDTSAAAPDPGFVYADTTGDDYLRGLRHDYGLDAVTASAKTDFARVLHVLRWTHEQWDHNGSNVPSEPYATTILKEVADGKRYRCVEYGIVSADALNSLGMHARVLGLSTADVETRKYGAGHVAAEAYLRDVGKWVFLDGQFDVVPVLDGMPLNAVEFGRALAERPDEVQLVNLDGPLGPKARRSYLRFVGVYLYYFNVSYDNRARDGRERLTVDGQPSLMLVPEGAPEPRVFQRTSPTRANYTRSVAAFYGAP